MASSLTEKVFIVTGSASGMGLATAKILLSRGASLGLCDLNGSSLEKVVHNLESDQKKRVLAEPIDIADRSAVASFIQTTKKHFGRLDGVANIAGVAGHKLGNETVWETTDEEFEHIIGVNVKGLFHVLGESLNPGVLEEFGSVVHISSMFSMRGYPKGAVFSASKHAAIGMVKSAAIEAGERNIRVNAVMPGAIDTPMLRILQDSGADDPAPNTPISRLGKPEEVAEVVAFLLSDASSFVSGASWGVDGGANA